MTHPVTFRLSHVLAAALAAVVLACLLFGTGGCGGSTDHNPETLTTAAGVPQELCWTGCLYLEGPELVINNEPTQGCFWSFAEASGGCVEVETPAAAVVLVERGNCRESCR